MLTGIRRRQVGGAMSHSPKAGAVTDDAQGGRALEALLFAARAPLSETALAERLPPSADVAGLLAALAERYRGRGIELAQVAGGWAFRTAPDLAHLLKREAEVQRRLSRAALETLAIVAYRQPATRAEIEAVRGVAASRGTLDILFEQGWIEPRGRRRAPGRPVTWATTPDLVQTHVRHGGFGQ